MQEFQMPLPQHAAVLLLATIKETISKFDAGDTNVMETLEHIALLLHEFEQAASRPRVTGLRKAA